MRVDSAVSAALTLAFFVCKRGLKAVPLSHAAGSMYTGAVLWKQSADTQTTQHRVKADPAVGLGMHSKDRKTHVHEKSCE